MQSTRKISSQPVQLPRRSAQIEVGFAKAAGRDHATEFAGCLGQAHGAASVWPMLFPSRDLDLIQPDTHDALLHQVVEVRRMLSGLLRSAAPSAV